ncbi:MAG: hypothetical protein M0007_10850, partial [Actinomycetota bacterium]|nr:hypothetical protein [Actinomycetota bacterium]
MAPRQIGGRLAALAATLLAATVVLAPTLLARSSLIDLGVPFWDFVSSGSLMTHQDGQPVWISAAAGYPSMLGEVNAATGEVLDTARLDGANAVYGYAQAKSGIVYLGAAPNAQLYSYVPGSSTTEDLGSPAKNDTVIWSLAYDGKTGLLYGGLGANAELFSYNPATKAFSLLGSMAAGHAFVRAVTIYDGIVYAGLGGQAGLVAYNPQTGAKADILPPGNASAESVNNIQAVRGDLFVHLTNGQELVLSIPSDKLIATIGNVGGPGVTPQTDGDHVAYLAGGSLYEFDLHTDKSSEVSSNLPAYQAQYLASSESDAIALVQVGSSQYPGWSVAGMVSKGTYWLDNPDDGYLASGPVAVNASVGTIESAHGSATGDVYASSYLSGDTMILDPTTNQMTVELGPGQAESIADDGSEIALGIYPGAVIWLYNPAQPWNWGPYAKGTENPSRLATIGDSQDRPMSMVVGPHGTMYVGTVPVAGALGGALSTITPGGKVTTYRNLIPDQSPISLVMTSSGLIVGATTVSGGIGIQPTASTAELFVWNPTTQKLVSTLAPFPGTPALSALTLGPNGLVYGLSNTELFAYDPTTNTIVNSRTLPWTSGTGYGTFDWGSDTSLLIGPDGNLYGAVDGRAFE